MLKYFTCIYFYFLHKKILWKLILMSAHRMICIDYKVLQIQLTFWQMVKHCEIYFLVTFATLASMQSILH